MSKASVLATSRATIVRPKSLQSFKEQASPEKHATVDSYDATNGLYSSFVGDQLQNQFHFTRDIFEAGQARQSSPLSPTSPVSGNTSPAPSSPVTERLESFASLKQRFECDMNNNNNNNNNERHAPPKATRHSSCNLGTSRYDCVGYTSPESSFRGSTSSMELNDKHRRCSDMAIVREKIAIAKEDLAEANERREVAGRAYAEEKRRIVSAKQKSNFLREQIRSLQDVLERKQKKIDNKTKRLEARSIAVEENRRAAEHYDRGIETETEWVRQMMEEIEAYRWRRRTTAERIRDMAQRISPLKAAIEETEAREEKARSRARRLGDILTKSTIRLRNARALSLSTDKRTSFNGCQPEDARKQIVQQRKRTARAKSDISYLEYRRQLLREQLAEYKDDLQLVLMRLNPYRQQRALGFMYTRLPMSEEL